MLNVYVYIYVCVVGTLMCAGLYAQLYMYIYVCVIGTPMCADTHAKRTRRQFAQSLFTLGMVSFTEPIACCISS